MDCTIDWWILRLQIGLDGAAFHLKPQMHPLNYTAGAWALNLNVSSFGANIDWDYIAKIDPAIKNKQLESGNYWMLWMIALRQHMCFPSAKCLHCQGCVPGDPSAQHVMGWSHFWHHLNACRSGMGSLPSAGSGNEKVDSCKLKFTCALRSKSLHATWNSL